MPYLGYISLIKHTDQFILLDEVQFIRHGWIERNRILQPGWESWQYIKVPLEKHTLKSFIKDIKIKQDENWKEKIITQMVHYKNKAPHYKDVISFLEMSIPENETSIVNLNKITLEKICSYLNIKCSIDIFTAMERDIEKPLASDEWALNICKSIGDVDEYWNPIGGMEFFSREKYEKAGIDLKFHNVKLNSYIQRIGRFEPGLSIIDVMMFNDVDTINKMLDDYDLF